MVLRPQRHIDLSNAILFLKHLQALHNPPPVILISGSPLAEPEQEALAHGAFSFVRKPFDLTELDRLVRLALESRKGYRRCDSHYSSEAGDISPPWPATQRAALEALRRVEGCGQ